MHIRRRAWGSYRQVSNIRRTLVGNETVDHSDVAGASPVGATPTTSSFSTKRLGSLDWEKTTARRDEKHLSLVRLILEILRYFESKRVIFFSCVAMVIPCRLGTLS